ncbi:DUF262 domain-containing protein [Pseudomonas sp. MS-1(2024)]|uniref:DUF262 domain-containing protein n=1 Tax=Pseudomonas sp. MS-1(2024) TaxID=3112251 RepID=UPI002DB864B3|nr:DUF262 domain-containing protein [Pseudomonas sp. MS-1(2024)]MEC4169501.1 DUF262 domain-containing protein [Pseudomonas sp. MS-1(2024)]
MSFQTPITISAAIRNIENNQYLLPAIQREFEWGYDKIEWLFDSIMRNYPISSFLFWRVEGDTKTNYKFYQFLKDFKQRYKTHNEEFNTSNHNDFTAVLDGQQRLTSLYIGLRGSYAYRTPRLHEENTERVYPTRHLYLNIEKPLENEEDGRIYEFKFLTNNEFNSNKATWFRVSEILALSDDFEFNKYLDSHDLKSNEFSYRSLAALKNVIHSKPIINFFLETEQSIDKALNIFIRINSGGEPLNFSDLIMSIAVANWDKKDARKEIHTLVDNVRDKGFTISKDFILKAFLYLHSKDIKFKVTNFSKSNAIEFEKEWDKIRDSVLSVFDLVKSFGFTDSTLTSKNALIPIIYYIYHKDIYTDFHTKIAYMDDRSIIKKWLHVALIKRIFGGTSDSVLSQIRKAFTNDVAKTAIEFDSPVFPVNSINENTKRDTGITDEFIADILLTQKDDMYAFSILALLYPNLDYKNNNFHKDHMHPENTFSDISVEDYEKYGWETYNSIANLQMLDANENMSKQHTDLLSWVDAQTKNQDRPTFLKNHLIPDISLGIVDFGEFIEARKLILTDKLKQILS